MEAHRHRGSSLEARDEAILDAVSEGLRRYGPRKLTAQDIADTAGISRMTLYRAMGSMDNAILLALTREFSRAVEELREALPNLDGATRLAIFLGAGARAFVESELISSVVAHQPELVEPYLSGRLGRSQEIVLEAIAELLGEGQADGSVPLAAPSALTLLLLVRGVALGAPLLDPDDFHTSCAELTDMIAATFGARELGSHLFDDFLAASETPHT
ncbi:TetR/AcrR family transcriptional regulator [Leucobacter sp. BZR 635]